MTVPMDQLPSFVGYADGGLECIIWEAEGHDYVFVPYRTGLTRMWHDGYSEERVTDEELVRLLDAWWSLWIQFRDNQYLKRYNRSSLPMKETQ